MIIGGGKRKGSAFEREICVKLSLWVSNGTQEDVFWRSAVSGGRSTVAARKGKRLAAQAGDISCIHPIGVAFASKYLAECKSYASLDYQGILTGRGKLLEFWRVVQEEAQRCGKMPFLIAKQNRQPTTICLDFMGMRTLGLGEAMGSDPLSLLIVPSADMYIYSANDIFAKCKPPQ